VVVSMVRLPKIEEFKKRMGWRSKGVVLRQRLSIIMCLS